MLAGLSAWGVLARVPVYAVAVHTPLALDPALQVVMTPVAGQVRVTHLQVDREVQAGEVLVELDSTDQRLQLEEAQQHLLALAAHQTARRQEGAALEAAWQATAQAAQAAQAEAQTRHDDAVRTLQVAQEKVQRLGPLTPLADLQPQKTAVDTTRRGLQQLEHTQQVQAAEWRARLAQHQREVVVLEGDLAVATARLARLAHTLEGAQLRAQRRAPWRGGRPPARDGGPGRGMARLLGPPGAFRVTAHIPLQWRAGACGRASSPGSVAPASPRPAWALPATVAQVAEAGPDALVRVVLRLAPEALAQLPLQPLAVGTVVVEVAQAAPLTMVIRTLAQSLWGRPGRFLCLCCLPTDSDDEATAGDRMATTRPSTSAPAPHHGDQRVMRRGGMAAPCTQVGSWASLQNFQPTA